MVVLVTAVDSKRRLASPAASSKAIMAPKNPSSTNKQAQSISEVVATSASNLPVSNSDTIQTKSNQDKYCWVCHKDRCNVSCHSCSRSFHIKCLPPSVCEVNSSGRKIVQKKDNWLCIECELISAAESEEGKSDTMRRINVEQFCNLLRNALTTVKNVTDITFHNPVNEQVFTDYRQFIVKPMDFAKMEQKIHSKEYTSTEAFLSDCKWICHNSYIYNNATHPLTVNARYMLKVARNEMLELETCPDCFSNYYADTKNFFQQPCTKPHTLVFAKLEGHPLWPSKVVKIDRKKRVAEVRFFGAHDKAEVPFASCFLIPEKYPNWKIPRNQKTKFDAAIAELNFHLAKLEERFPGLFKHSPPKTTLNPNCPFLNDPDIPWVPEEETSTPSKQEDLSKLSSGRKEDTKEEGLKAKKANEVEESEDKINSTMDEYTFNADEENEPNLVVTDEKPSEKKKKPLQKRRSLLTSTGGLTTPVPVVEPKLPSSDKKTNSLNLLQDTSKSPIANERPKRPLPNGIDDIGSNSTPILPKKSKNRRSVTFEDQNVNTDATGDLNDDVAQLKKQIVVLQNQLEACKAQHSLELEQALKDQKTKLEDEKRHELDELQNNLTTKFEKMAVEIKRKQWCSYCTKEAKYFCCWNSSYCGYNCQILHWPQHLHSCQQNTNNEKTSKDKNSVAAANASVSFNKDTEPVSANKIEKSQGQKVAQMKLNAASHKQKTKVSKSEQQSFVEKPEIIKISTAHEEVEAAEEKMEVDSHPRFSEPDNHLISGKIDSKLQKTNGSLSESSNSDNDSDSEILSEKGRNQETSSTIVSLGNGSPKKLTIHSKVALESCQAMDKKKDKTEIDQSEPSSKVNGSSLDSEQAKTLSHELLEDEIKQFFNEKLDHLERNLQQFQV